MKEIRVVVVRDRTGRVQMKTIQSPEDAFKLVARKAKDLDREHFFAIHLNARNIPIALEVVSIGTLSTSLVHPREVFKAAIVAGAAALIVCHNHPSGDKEPSPEDRATTRRLAKVGELVGIPLIDHLILDGRGDYSSIKEKFPNLFRSGGGRG